MLSLDKAIQICPNYAEAFHNSGIIFQKLKNIIESLKNFERALELKADYDYLLGNVLHNQALLCDWRNYFEKKSRIENRVSDRMKVIPPFPFVSISNKSFLQLKSSQLYIETKHPSVSVLGEIQKRVVKDRIRIGYYSADFHNHATAYLMAEFFELHDKNKFELYAFSFGPDQQDEMRGRLVKAFDRFIDVRQQSDQTVAKLSRELEIDIAVDLKGFTSDSRTGIFAYRAAPIQVNYLGYPGTMGASYIDYIIADKVLIPQDFQPYYSEKVVYLPNSYQVNDRKRVISEKQYTRQELGLPEDSFVFCCFNNNYKITPDMFDSWMRILHVVEKSVLWLIEDNKSVVTNLRQEAEKRGVAPERLVFAQRMPLAEHLSRHSHADLFIDTLPCNAHTTASDALWAGLPVLTLIGESFAGRVAASLLSAMNLQELITHTPEEYEALAIELAKHPEKLMMIRERLVKNRLTSTLFDTVLYTRHMEQAYIKIMERYWENLPTEHIWVA